MASSRSARSGAGGEREQLMFASVCLNMHLIFLLLGDAGRPSSALREARTTEQALGWACCNTCIWLTWPHSEVGTRFPLHMVESV